MGDAGKPQLVLKGLSAGVYVFRLDVSGQNAHGFTLASVTVKPGERPV